jgi:hypothetical protein
VQGRNQNVPGQSIKLVTVRPVMDFTWAKVKQSVYSYSKFLFKFKNVAFGCSISNVFQILQLLQRVGLDSLVGLSQGSVNWCLLVFGLITCHNVSYNVDEVVKGVKRVTSVLVYSIVVVVKNKSYDILLMSFDSCG